MITWNVPQVGEFDLEKLTIKTKYPIAENANQISMNKDENLFVCALDSPDIQLVDI